MTFWKQSYQFGGRERERGSVLAGDFCYCQGAAADEIRQKNKRNEEGAAIAREREMEKLLVYRLH